MSKVILYIAASLDGFIARPDGNLDWLTGLPNPDQVDHGYGDLLAQTSCIIMGRSTYQELLGFGMEWPYTGTETRVMTGDPEFRPATPDTFALTGDIAAKFEEIRSWRLCWHRGINELWIHKHHIKRHVLCQLCC